MIHPDCFLLNLASMETIQLPPLNLDMAVGILTTPPSDPNCRILFIDGNDDLIICSPGDSEYSKQKMEDPVLTMTRFGGKTYCLTPPVYSLLTIELEGSSPRFTKLITVGNESKLFSFEQTAPYLLDFFGEMFLVCKCSSLKSSDWATNFGVFKFDFDAREWVEVKSIGNNAIFLTDYCYGTCYPVADHSMRRNSIYYTQPDDRNLYVYDLEYQSITTFLPFPNVSDRRSDHDCLPPELLSLISSNLYAGDNALFRAICKTWRSITIAPPLPLPLPSPFDHADSPFPWLFHIPKSNTGRGKFFHPIYNYTWEMDLPAQLVGAVIRFSKYGWLLMARDMVHPFLFHPLSKVIVDLPELPRA
ncbi:Uncharacterized protein TCM_025442 [Theobroma cacao]|uniref:KIB1-4 beta-propeller domain-containing protein n=1 Tax=Theobroma cacao TaxID=3641 RepID=A0A061F049_THECC|nr:Uncharacterized protein TCM_025442 [Theobroma cacao]